VRYTAGESAAQRQADFGLNGGLYDAAAHSGCREPTNEELAERMELSVSKVLRIA